MLTIDVTSMSLRIVVLQRVLPQYRKQLFIRLQELSSIDLKVIIGEDISGTKVRSTSDFGVLNVTKLPTTIFNCYGRKLVNHRGLLKAIQAFSPDVIVCEGESNFVSYLKAAIYRVFNPQVTLIHWSLGGLPGKVIRPGLRYMIKKILLSMFDGYVVYSSFGKKQLERFGCRADDIQVLTNVSDIESHLQISDDLSLSKVSARLALGIKNRFTILFIGAFEQDKNIDLILSAARSLRDVECNVILVGDGELRRKYQNEVIRRNQQNISFLGARSWEFMAICCRASDIFVLPGRGGMVISEAMAHGLPVVAFQADGTELDLIKNFETGFLLQSGSEQELASVVGQLSRDPDLTERMGKRARDTVTREYSLQKLASSMSDFVGQIHARKDRKKRQV